MHPTTVKILFIIASIMVLLSLFIAAVATSGDSLALAREETNQMQIHENGLSQRQALNLCTHADNGCTVNPTQPESLFQRATGTVAFWMTIMALIALFAGGTVALLRRQPVRPIQQPTMPRLAVVNEPIQSLVPSRRVEYEVL